MFNLQCVHPQVYSSHMLTQRPSRANTTSAPPAAPYPSAPTTATTTRPPQTRAQRPCRHSTRAPTRTPWTWSPRGPSPRTPRCSTRTARRSGTRRCSRGTASSSRAARPMRSRSDGPGPALSCASVGVRKLTAKSGSLWGRASWCTFRTRARAGGGRCWALTATGRFPWACWCGPWGGRGSGCPCRPHPLGILYGYVGPWPRSRRESQSMTRR